MSRLEVILLSRSSPHHHLCQPMYHHPKLEALSSFPPPVPVPLTSRQHQKGIGNRLCPPQASKLHILYTSPPII